MPDKIKKIGAKKLAGVLVLVGAVIVSFLIVGGGPEKNEVGGAEAGKPESNKSKDLNLNYQNKEVDISYNNKRGEVVDLQKQIEEMNENNLTDKFNLALTKSFLETNSDRFEEFKKGNFLPPNKENLQKSLQEFQREASNIFDFNLFTEKDILISEDNSKEAKIAYFKKVKKITDNNFKDFDMSIAEIMEELWVDKKTKNLREYVDIASKQINDLLAVEAPSDFKALHLQSLNLWKKKEVSYKALANYAVDPLKSMVALQEAYKLLLETNEVQNQFLKKAQNLN